MSFPTIKHYEISCIVKLVVLLNKNKTIYRELPQNSNVSL